MVEMTRVDSSLIRRIGYDAEQRAEIIEFQPTAHQAQRGRTWRFHDVPPEKHEGFLNATSKGVFFGRQFASKHSSTIEPNQGRCPTCGDIGLEGCKCDDCGCDVYRSEE